VNYINKFRAENKWIPDGFHFLGVEESKSRRALLDKIYIFFREKGYSEVTPPGFDFTSSFSNYIASNEEDKILKLKDSSGKDISPSFDLTLQVVKGLAGFTEEGLNQKVFYTGKIVKENYKQNTDRREIFQVGAEILGHSNANTFKMLFSHINDLVKEFNLKHKLTLILGNVNVIKTILSKFEFDREESSHFAKLLYQKDLPSLKEYMKNKKIDSNIQNLIAELTLSFDLNSSHKILKELTSRLNLDLNKFLIETEDLSEFSSKLDSIDFCIDYSLVSDLDYYTGFLFQGYYTNISYPIFMGGAYDHLFFKFANIEKNACGFAFNLDNIEGIVRRE
jgi:ATP phosphoribosyltransferase regulatory subunit